MHFLRLCLLILFFPSTTVSFSQTQPAKAAVQEIRGRVVEALSEKPLEFATVSALRDGQLVGGALTDEHGDFVIQIKPGEYTIIVEFLGYGKKTIESIRISEPGASTDLGVIVLDADAEVLEEVEVVGEKADVQFALDKRIYNVGKDMVTRSGTADDVLDNIPSITVDLDGNVSLRGSNQVRILVDGRPAGINGVRGSSLLRTIQASQIERVEVITNPSARYEAEGTAGIINIVLKKNKKSGLNGSFDGTIGTPVEAGIGIHLNYRRSKINWFTRLGMRKSKLFGDGLVDQRFTDNRFPARSIQTRNHTRANLSYNLRFGLDYHFDDRSTLTSYFDGDLSAQNNSVRLQFEDFFQNAELGDLSVRDETEVEQQSKVEYLLSFKHTFGNKKHYYQFDFQYQLNAKDQGSDFVEQDYFLDLDAPIGDPAIQRSQNDQSEDNYILKADYNYPFNKEGKLELGYRGSIRDIRNDFAVDSLWRRTGEFVRIEQFTNKLLYDEDIHAFYASVGDKMSKFSYLAGLRMEYSLIATDLLLTNEKNPRRYANLFPSLFLSYDINEKNALQISYSRRIRRPVFFELNPFFTFSNNRSIFRGNPNLDPQYTDSYELNYLVYLSAMTISAGLYHRSTSNYIQRILTVLPDRTTVRQPENIGLFNAYGLELTYNLTPVDWWKINGNFNFFYFELDGAFGQEVFVRKDFAYRTRLSSKWNFAKKYDTQLTLRYRGAAQTAQGRRNAILSVDFAASTDLLQNKATLNFSVRDVFNSRRWGGQSRGPNFVIDTEFFWSTRRISLAFNYRLNQKKKHRRSGAPGQGMPMFGS